jgi:hypothetical protein
MPKLKLKRTKEESKPAELKNYLQSSEDVSDEMNEDIERLVQEDSAPRSPKKLRFWSNWSKGNSTFCLRE